MLMSLRMSSHVSPVSALSVQLADFRMEFISSTMFKGNSPMVNCLYLAITQYKYCLNSFLNAKKYVYDLYRYLLCFTGDHLNFTINPRRTGNEMSVYGSYGQHSFYQEFDITHGVNISTGKDLYASHNLKSHDT